MKFLTVRISASSIMGTVRTGSQMRFLRKKRKGKKMKRGRGDRFLSKSNFLFSAAGGMLVLDFKLRVT